MSENPQMACLNRPAKVTTLRQAILMYHLNNFEVQFKNFRKGHMKLVEQGLVPNELPMPKPVSPADHKRMAEEAQYVRNLEAVNMTLSRKMFDANHEHMQEFKILYSFGWWASGLVPARLVQQDWLT